MHGRVGTLGMCRVWFPLRVAGFSVGFHLHSQNARALNDLYKKTPMRMGGPGGMLDMTGTAGSGIVSTEADDARKEEEESDFTFAADDYKE